MIIAAAKISHPNQLDYLAKITKYSEVEALLLCGDVSLNESFLKELSQFNVLMVSGDEDDIHIVKLAKKYNILVDGKVIDMSGIKIGGVGAINTSLDYSALISNREKINVLLTHFPPYGCLDKYPPLYIPSGLKSLRILLETIRPSIAFVGHAAKPAIEYCGSTPLIGIAGFIVFVDSLKPQKVRFIPLSRSSSLGGNDGSSIM